MSTSSPRSPRAAPARRAKPTRAKAKRRPAPKRLSPVVRRPAAVAVPPRPAAPPPPPGWPAVFPPAVAAQAAPGGVPLVDDALGHLLRRTTFGSTPALLAEVQAMGAGAWLDSQLNPGALDDTAVDAAVAAKWPLLGGSAADMRAGIKQYSWDGMSMLQRATLLRMTCSRRQLFEVMVDFWDQHLNVTCPSDKVWSTRHVYDREVLRRFALGSFRDLLKASATSAAMLQYLDNAQSRGAKPNENYGRELLELHTVGLGAGYTEADMRASALALTGLSVADDGSDTFAYKPAYRFLGPVQVMGWSDPNRDAAVGLAVAASYLDHLARHPATAARIATKLAVRFVSDTPPQGLVDRLAATYLANDTAIVPVLRALFSAPEFWSSLGQKYRRPLEWCVATLRQLGAQATPDPAVKGWEGFAWRLGTLGQAPHAWRPPDGYPDIAPAWMSTADTLGRWNLAIASVDKWWKEGIAQPDSTWQNLLPGPAPATAGALVDRLCLRLLGQRLPDAHRGALLAFFGRADNQPIEDWRLKSRVSPLAALVLSSPVWSLR